MRFKREFSISTGIGDGRQIHITFPHSFWKSHTWDRWGELQVKILHAFMSHWQHTDVYIRFQTHIPDFIEPYLMSCKYEKYATRSEHESLFLIPECTDTRVWERIFASVGAVHLSRMLVVVDSTPKDWHNTVASLFGITQKLSDRYSPNEFIEDLSICKCLCYSIDNDLNIGKIDLPDNIIFAILENIALEYDLQLLVKKDLKKYKKLS
jgi:hypothetical protein